MFADLHKVTSKFEQTFCLVLKACALARRAYNHKPDKIILTFSLYYSQSLWAASIRFQELVTGYSGTIDNHLPKDRRISTLSSLPIEIKPYSIPSSSPIPQATMAFSDSNKNSYDILIQHNVTKDMSHIIPNPGSVQLGVLLDTS